MQDRKKDFQFILLIKESDAYVFTSEANHYQKLRRKGITKSVNKVMRSVFKQLLEQPNLTIHSFLYYSVVKRFQKHLICQTIDW